MGKKIASLILALAGVIFFAMPLNMAVKSVTFRKNGIEATGLVSGVHSGTRGGPDRIDVIFNTAEGNEISTVSYRREHTVTGQSVRLWYLEENPEKINFGEPTGYHIRAMLIALVLIILGGYFTIRLSKEDLAKKRLMSTGLKINTPYSIGRNEMFRAGDHNPWIIKASWKDLKSNREYTFTSKNFTADPADFLKDRNSIDVFINPDNPEKYYMDTSFMPVDKTIG